MIIYHDFSGEFDFFSIILPEKSKIIFPQVNKTVIKLLETVIKIYRCYSNTIVYFFLRFYYDIYSHFDTANRVIRKFYPE